MLSAQGYELGTVGFDHFLQQAVDDALESGCNENHGTFEQVVSGTDNIDLLQRNPEKLGIQKFDLAWVAERLEDLSEVYKDAAKDAATPNLIALHGSGELYTLLFGRLLMPPKYAPSSSEDPTGLKVQIQTLIKILTIKGIWYDFGDVRWRISIGRILWSDPFDGELSFSSVNPSEWATERNILLLQLLLSCELLARLDAITALSTDEVKNVFHLTLNEVNKFREFETRKSKWDLVFARRFLENVEARSITVDREVPKQEPERRGLFSSSPTVQEPVTIDHVDVIFLPRKSQQLEGLFYFATAIGWPEADRFKAELTNKLHLRDEAFSIPSPSVYATPLSTTRSVRSTKSSSYFDPSPDFSRQTSGFSLQLQPPSSSITTPHTSPNGSPSVEPTNFAPEALIGGWLTRSYLTGLILPGEAISHFLISALLENDAAAMVALGDSTILYSGFVYKQRSWWSKESIIGRVLACLPGSAECIGWVALTCVPQGFHAGWIDVRAESGELRSEKARIEQGQEIRADSSFLASKEPGDVLPSDLTLPLDSETRPEKSMRFDGLRLEPAQAADETGVGEHYNATLHFSASSNINELGPYVISLEYMVQFVSVYPCRSPPRDQLAILRSVDESNKVQMTLLAHPLHNEHTYEIIAATSVLAAAFVFPSRAKAPAGDKHVYILDARDDATLELIARGWCSSRGENAIISKVGVACLACSVREARALAIRIVIRIG